MRTLVTLTTVLALSAAAGCGKSDSNERPPAPGPKPVSPAPKEATPAPSGKADPNAAAATTKAPTGGEPAAKPAEPPAPATIDRSSAKSLVKSAQALAKAGDRKGLAEVSSKMTQRVAMQIPLPQVQALLSGEVGDVDVNGGREVVTLKQAGGRTRKIVTYNRPGGYELDLMKSLRWQEVTPGEADPLNKPLTIEEATEGIDGEGALHASIETSMGTFDCELHEKKTPKTVANFVGLARGLRGWKDPQAGKWVKKPLYDGLTFHRVIPGFMIQGGDPAGNGSGGPGYTFEDEFDLSLRHTRGGLLSMANRGPNTNGSQFFVTEKATPWLDDGHTIFGACEPIDLVRKITGVPKNGSTPKEPVTIKKVSFSRK